jgi:hypothetical protein
MSAAGSTARNGAASHAACLRTAPQRDVVARHPYDRCRVVHHPTIGWAARMVHAIGNLSALALRTRADLEHGGDRGHTRGQQRKERDQDDDHRGRATDAVRRSPGERLEGHDNGTADGDGDARAGCGPGLGDGVLDIGGRNLRPIGLDGAEPGAAGQR